MTRAGPSSAPAVGAGGGSSRRDVLLGGALLATAGAGFACLPREPLVALPGGGIAGVVPDRVGPWRPSSDPGFVLPPSDEEAAALVYEEQLTRGYDDGVAPTIMLLVAYDRTQSGLLQIHRPESCYPGAGFALSPPRAGPIALSRGVSANANFFTATRGDRIEQLLYWTRVGDAFPRDWHDQRRSIAALNLRGYVPDGVLVRMSTITADADAAHRRLIRFAEALFAASPPAGRRLLGGPAIA